MTNLILLSLSLLLAALRVYGVTHQSFQAAAHLFVGGLIVRAWYERKTTAGYWSVVLSVGLSAVELACVLRDHL